MITTQSKKPITYGNKADSETILIIAGEASGDLYGAKLAKEILTLRPNAHIVGIGCEHMNQAGVKLLMDAKDMAVVGMIESKNQIKSIVSARQKIRNYLKDNKPNLIILIDYPGFNLRIAKLAKKSNVNVLYYISPQIWAWRKHRIYWIKKWVDHMAVVLPFEYDLYKKAGVPVTFVGHPLTKHVTNPLSTLETQKMLNINPGNKTVTLLPGSRIHEINRLLPEMLAAAALLKTKYPNIQFVLARAPTLNRAAISPYLRNYAHLDIAITTQTYSAIDVSDVVITASGTATLETALLKTPMVIIYKMSAFAFAIAKRIVNIKYMGLCNIILNKRICPELIQKDVTAHQIAKEVEKFLDDNDYYTKTKQQLSLIKTKLGSTHASHNVAKIALSMSSLNSI